MTHPTHLRLFLYLKMLWKNTEKNNIHHALNALNVVQNLSPDMPPQDLLAATRFTIGDFEVSCLLSRPKTPTVPIPEIHAP